MILDASSVKIRDMLRAAKAVETKEKYYRIAAEIKRVTKDCHEQLAGQLELDFMKLAEEETRFVEKALRGASVKADFELPAPEDMGGCQLRQLCRIRKQGNVSILLPPPELPPLPGSLEMEFDLVLKDGCNVKVHFRREFFLRYNSHIELYGDISSTGYRSVFTGEVMYETDDVVKQKIEEIAEYWRADMLDNIAKEAKKKRRRKKV
jgi:hypothetical protein